jgi:DNA-binding MarR family transcriptional regulator
VLAVLNEEASMSMGRLADLTSVDRTTLTRTLGLMEADGLIVRAPNLEDRRGIDISLKAKGRRLLDMILPQVLAQTERAVQGLTGEDVAHLRRLLARMVENLKP